MNWKLNPKQSSRCRCQWAGSADEKRIILHIIFIVKRGRTGIVFSSVLAVKVTKEIPKPKNFYGKIFSGRIDEGC